MLALFTDFGLDGPYLGQMTAVLHRDAPGIPVVNLMADAPAQDPRAGAYLLSAFSAGFPAGTVFVCVIDPGVGTGREAVVVWADGSWFVGPDNGLFEVVARRAQTAKWWRIRWTVEKLSSSFHGRDLFAPVAAAIARGQAVPGTEKEWGLGAARLWPDDLLEVLYIDRYGNAITGMRAGAVAHSERIRFGTAEIGWARTFGDVAVGDAFWYENSSGLLEIAVNCGSAAQVLGLSRGAKVELLS